MEENNKICYLTRLSGKTNPSSLKKREKVRRGWKQKGGQKAINFMTQNFKLKLVNFKMSFRYLLLFQKKPKKFELTTMVPQVELFSFLFIGRIKDTKKTF